MPPAIRLESATAYSQVHDLSCRSNERMSDKRLLETRKYYSLKWISLHVANILHKIEWTQQGFLNADFDLKQSKGKNMFHWLKFT